MDLDSVLSEMRDAGLLVDRLDTSGHIVRCKVSTDKGSKRSGWYVCSERRLPDGEWCVVGVYGNWKQGFTAALRRASSPSFSADQRRWLDEQMAVHRQAVEAERKAKAAAAAERAGSLWQRFSSEGASEYLARKGVRGFGVKFVRGTVVVPVRTVAGDLVGLQWIGADGGKRFLTGTPKQGAFHVIGELQPGCDVVCIAEGYATAASIHMATQLPVVVAFDAGNLRPVACAIRGHYQPGRLLICADNDAATPDNPGVRFGRDAAVAAGGLLAVPDFAGCAEAGAAC